MRGCESCTDVANGADRWRVQSRRMQASLHSDILS